VTSMGGVSRRRAPLAALAVCLLAALGVGGWVAVRAVLGGDPGQVLVVYVREENSTGLSALPSEVMEVSGLDLARGRLVLPTGAGPLPPGTRVLVLRETWVAGVLTRSRAVFVKRLPALVEPSKGEGPGAVVPEGEGVLLAFALLLDADGPGPGPRGSWPGGARITVEPQGLLMGPEGAAAGPVVLEPGQEWRLGAVREEGGVVVLSPDDPGYEDALRRAFYDGRPVSVLVVLNCGLWDTDRIENAGG